MYTIDVCVYMHVQRQRKREKWKGWMEESLHGLYTVQTSVV